MAAPKTKDCITNGTPGTYIEQKNKNIMEQYSTPKNTKCNNKKKGLIDWKNSRNKSQSEKAKE